MNNMYLVASKMVPLVAGNVLTTFKTNVEEWIMVIAVLIVAAVTLPHLAKGKKIKALGYLGFAAIVIAIIGDFNFLINGIKGIYTYFTGKPW